MEDIPLSMSDTSPIPQNDKGVTVLGIAVGFNRKEIVSLLIEKGADVQLTDSKENTVLHYAAGAMKRTWKSPNPLSPRIRLLTLSCSDDGWQGTGGRKLPSFSLQQGPSWMPSTRRSRPPLTLQS